jgi:hypothetical protein
MNGKTLPEDYDAITLKHFKKIPVHWLENKSNYIYDNAEQTERFYYGVLSAETEVCFLNKIKTHLRIY